MVVIRYISLLKMGNNLGVNVGSTPDYSRMHINGVNQQTSLETKKKFHIQSFNVEEDPIELGIEEFNDSLEEFDIVPCLDGKYHTDEVSNFILDGDIKHQIKQHRVLLLISSNMFFITYYIEHNNKKYKFKQYDEKELNPWLTALFNLTSNDENLAIVPNTFGISFDRITPKDTINLTRKVYLNDQPKDEFTKSWAPNLHFMQALGCPIPPPTCACCERTRLVEPADHHTVCSTDTNYKFKHEDVWINLSQIT